MRGSGDEQVAREDRSAPVFALARVFDAFVCRSPWSWLSTDESSLLAWVCMTRHRRKDSDDRAEDPDPGPAWRHDDLRRPGGGVREHRAGPADDRITDGRERIHDAGRAFPGPHGRDLRPAGGRTQPAGRRRHGGDAGRARGGSAEADLRTRRRARGHLRQQRGRGERARAGDQASGRGQHAGRPRTAPRDGARGSGGGAGGDRGHPRDLRARRSRTRDGEVHRLHEPQGTDSARLPRPRSESRPTSVSRPRTTAAGTIRCSARTWST